jgi:hypothetical protein
MEVAELRLPAAGWMYHENNGSATTLAVDVAVMKVVNLGDRIAAFRYCRSNCPKGAYNQLADDPSPPDHILVLGYPLDFGFTLTEQRPLIRSGIVSFRSNDEFISIDQAGGVKKTLARGAYLIDAKMLRGNSGGPVIIANPLEPMRLGGLVTGTNQSLDFAVVTPVSQISQTLDRAAPSEVTGRWFALAGTR